MDIQNLLLNISESQLLPIVILYVGPETLLPLTSALAAIVGVVLIVWRQLVAFLSRVWRIFTRR